MKHLITYILVLLSFVAIAQNTDREEDRVGFACSIGGESTPIVFKVGQLLANKDFTEIKNLLYSASVGEKFLATFVLEKLSDRQMLNLSQLDIDAIKNIKESNELVAVCSGCMYNTNVPLTELMEKKHQINQSAEYWFESIYKTYYKKSSFQKIIPKQDITPIKK